MDINEKGKESAPSQLQSKTEDSTLEDSEPSIERVFTIEDAKRACGKESLEEVSILSLKSQSIKTLADDIFGAFQNLKELDVEDNMLEYFPEKHVCGMLKTLNCSHNRLKSVKGITCFPNLEVLHITGNTSLQVSDRYKLVSSLPKLKKLDGKDVETMREAMQRLDAMIAQKVQDFMCSKEVLKQMPTVLPEEEADKAVLRSKISQFAKTKITCGPEVLKDYREHKIEQLMVEEIEKRYARGRKKRKADQNGNHLNGDNGTSDSAQKKLRSESEFEEKMTSTHCQTETPSKNTLLEYSLVHLLQTHSQNNDPKDLETKVWMCEFEPDLKRPGQTTSLCATCGGDSVCFIDCSTGTVVKKYKQPKENFYCLAWTVINIQQDKEKPAKKCTLLAVAGWHGDIKLIDPEKLVCYLEVSHHKRPVDALLFHPKKPSWLFSGSEDKSIVLWDIKEPFQPLTDVKASKLLTLRAGSIIRQITLTPSGQCLIGGGDDGCYVWDLDRFSEGEIRHAKYKLSFIGEKRTPVDSVVSITENLIATKRLEEGNIQIWYSKSGFKESDAVLTHKLPWRQTETPFLKFNYSPGSNILLAGDDCGFIWVFDLTEVKDQLVNAMSGKKDPTILTRKVCLHCDNPYARMLNHVSASGDGSMIVAVSDTNVVAVWRKT